MNESNKRKFDNGEGALDRNRVIIIAAAAVVAVILLVILVINIFSKGKNGKNEGVLTPTATPTTAVVIPIAEITNTPVPATPTATPTVTPTCTPTATPTTAVVTPAITQEPTITPVPPVQENVISAKDAYAILCKYKKEALSISKEVTEYQVSYDSSTTLINGTDCYRFTLSENVDGKTRNRGEFFISVDGACCYVQDVETGSFVPLPMG